MFDTGKRLTLFEKYMEHHMTQQNKANEETHVMNNKLDDINVSLKNLSESVIKQNGKIEITARDVLDTADKRYISKDTFNAALKSLREQARLVWIAIGVFAAIVAKVIDIIIEIYPKG